MRKRIAFAVTFVVLLLCLTACGKSKDVLAVESAISNIGEVTLNSADSIIAAQKLFEGLGESDRKSVSNYQELVNAVDKYTHFEEEYYQECYDEAVFKMLDTLVIAEELVSIIKMPPDKFKGNMLDAFVNYYAEYQSFIQFVLYYNESYNSFSEKFDSFEKTSIEAYRKAAFYTSQS